MTTEEKAQQIIKSMPDVTIKLTAAEMAALGQMAATSARLGMLADKPSNDGGRKIFDRGQEVARRAGIDVERTDLNTSAILRKIEQANLPDVEVTLTAAELVALTASMRLVERAFMILGGAQLTGWKKILPIAQEVANKVIKEMGENPAPRSSGLGSLVPRFQHHG